MGESEERIRVVGALSLDRFTDHEPMARESVLQKFDARDQDYALVIFHPQDREIGKSAKYLERIISVLKDFDLLVFVNYPNTDPDSKSIISIIDKLKDDECVRVFKNLERGVFLSLYKNARIQVGNSSSGIIESASIPLPVVNVGWRQKGRETGKNVIFTGVKRDEINEGVKKALSDRFWRFIEGMDNIYGDGNSVGRAMKCIKSIDFENMLYKTEDPLVTQ
jgi:UDP-hydrolysing UDP-N-acetyl-D-glucosamine 2-epimerase